MKVLVIGGGDLKLPVVFEFTLQLRPSMSYSTAADLIVLSLTMKENGLPCADAAADALPGLGEAALVGLGLGDRDEQGEQDQGKGCGNATHRYLLVRGRPSRRSSS